MLALVEQLGIESPRLLVRKAVPLAEIDFRNALVGFEFVYRQAQMIAHQFHRQPRARKGACGAFQRCRIIHMVLQYFRKHFGLFETSLCQGCIDSVALKALRDVGLGLAVPREIEREAGGKFELGALQLFVLSDRYVWSIHGLHADDVIAGIDVHRLAGHGFSHIGQQE